MNEWMNEWMKKWKLRRISFNPMFMLSLLMNKDSYNTRIIQCVNNIIFRKRFRVPGFGTGSGTLEPVPCNRLLRQITSRQHSYRVVNFPEIFGNISWSLEVIMSIIFIPIRWYSWERCSIQVILSDHNA